MAENDCTHFEYLYEPPTPSQPPAARNIELSSCMYNRDGEKYVFNATVSIDHQLGTKCFFEMKLKHSGSDDQHFYSNRQCIPIQIQSDSPRASVDFTISYGENTFTETIKFNATEFL